MSHDAPVTPSGAQSAVSEVICELVAANRILAKEEVVDAFGHISRRHPERPDRFLMSRARAPGLIEAADIMEFDLLGNPVGSASGKPYLERFIHAAIYEARPDVASVVHDHSHNVVPFTVSSERLKVLAHSGGVLGEDIGVWDVRDSFGPNTNLLVSDMAMGRDLAATLGARPVVLMRGHGAVLAAPSIRLATYLAITLDVQAVFQIQARQLGTITFMSPGEIAATGAILAPDGRTDAIVRTWEHWCARAHVPFTESGW